MEKLKDHFGGEEALWREWQGAHGLRVERREAERPVEASLIRVPGVCRSPSLVLYLIM